MPKAVVLPILMGATVCHLINDSIQAVVPALFPILHQTLHLSFTQIGIVAFANNLTASLIQPFIGAYTDRRPLPGLLPAAMLFTMAGLLVLSGAMQLWTLLIAVVLVGIGSAVFHPETSRIVVSAAGANLTTAQSIFQLGGNAGQALAPLLTVWLFVPYGQSAALLFVIVALAGAVLLRQLANWQHQVSRLPTTRASSVRIAAPYRQQTAIAIGLVMGITFARTWYFAGISNFYALFRMETLGDSFDAAQSYVFTFLLAAAFGTLMGGPVAGRFGQRNTLLMAGVIAAPLAGLLPYAAGSWVYILLALSGFMLTATFSITVTYTLLLMPGQVGKVSGLIFGLAFGLGALGSLCLGRISDAMGITVMLQVCSLIPVLALLAWFLPQESTIRTWYQPIADSIDE